MIKSIRLHGNNEINFTLLNSGAGSKNRIEFLEMSDKETILHHYSK